MVNKVVIAAAGRGTRMLHLTDDKPKHLIEVNGKPFLAYVLDNIFDAGYKEIALVAGYKKELIEDFVKNYLFNKRSSLKVKVINQYDKFNPEEKYGTACPLMLKEIRDFIGKDQFLSVYGDNLFSVEDLRLMNIEDEFCYIAGIKNDNPGGYGVLKERINSPSFLEKIIEKPEKFSGNIINAGLYKFTYEIFDKISEIKKSQRGEYEITDAVSLLSEAKKVKIKIISSWIDLGNPNDVEKVSNLFKSGKNKSE